jgi:hypothetical protein
MTMSIPEQTDLVRIYDRTAWYWDSLLHRVSYGHAYARLFKRLQEDDWLGMLTGRRGADRVDWPPDASCVVNAPFEIHSRYLPKMMARARSG